MTIHDFKIDNYVLHKNELCTVAAISKSGKIVVENVATKKFSKPVDRSELLTVELTPKLLNDLRFTRNSTSYNRNKIHILDSRGYPTYLEDASGHRVLIGVINSLSTLQNLIYDIENTMPMLP